MTEKIFKEELLKLNIEVTDYQISQLNKYQELLNEYNKVMNLTGIVEKEEVYLKHFYDSISIVKSVNLNEVENLCDIGTGAGFPGMVIKILFPNIKITLLDSLNKRLNFLNVVIKELKLDKIETVHTRAEEYAIKNRNKFDITTARAVSHLSNLLEYSIPMTKPNGYFIALKANASDEVRESKNALVKLNSKIEQIIEFDLRNNEGHRTIIKVKKISDNKKYPRKYSEIKRNRL